MAPSPTPSRTVRGLHSQQTGCPPKDGRHVAITRSIMLCAIVILGLAICPFKDTHFMSIPFKLIDGPSVQGFKSFGHCIEYTNNHTRKSVGKFPTYTISEFKLLFAIDPIFNEL